MADLGTLAAATITVYCRSQGWPEPVQEHEFHPERKWRFDYAWPQYMVAVELNGGVHNQGRHTRGKGYEEDRNKVNEATAAGWRVFEVTYRQLAKGLLWGWLDKVLGKEAA